MRYYGRFLFPVVMAGTCAAIATHSVYGFGAVVWGFCAFLELKAL